MHDGHAAAAGFPADSTPGICVGSRSVGFFTLASVPSLFAAVGEEHSDLQDLRRRKEISTKASRFVSAEAQLLIIFV